MNFATARVQEKMQIINQRLASISSRTGISFSQVLNAKSDALTNTGTTQPSSADQASAILMSSLGLGDSLAAAQTEGWDTSSTSALAASRSASYQRAMEKVLSAQVSATGTGANPAYRYKGDYADLIESVSWEYGLNPALVTAVVRAESNFNPNCLSSAGAMGLMQLMPGTAEGLGVTNAYDPEQNVDGGARFLMGQIVKYGGDVRMALASYNCGSGGLSKRDITDLTDPAQFERLPKETQTYLNRIHGFLAETGQQYLMEKNYYDYFNPGLG